MRPTIEARLLGAYIRTTANMLHKLLLTGKVSTEMHPCVPAAERGRTFAAECLRGPLTQNPRPNKAQKLILKLESLLAMKLTFHTKEAIEELIEEAFDWANIEDEIYAKALEGANAKFPKDATVPPPKATIKYISRTHPRVLHRNYERGRKGALKTI